MSAIAVKIRHILLIWKWSNHKPAHVTHCSETLHRQLQNIYMYDDIDLSVVIQNVTVEGECTSGSPVLQGKKQHTRTSPQASGGGGGGVSQQQGNSNCWDSVTLLLSCSDFLLCLWKTLESDEHCYDRETCHNERCHNSDSQWCRFVDEGFRQKVTQCQNKRP